MPTVEELRAKYKAIVAAKTAPKPESFLSDDNSVQPTLIVPVVKTPTTGPEMLRVVKQRVGVPANYKPKPKADWDTLGDEELLEKAIEIISDAGTEVTEMPDFVSYVAPNGRRCNVGCGNNGHQGDFWICLDSVGSQWKSLPHLRNRLNID
jgi:hypothetical protein